MAEPGERLSPFVYWGQKTDHISLKIDLKDVVVRHLYLFIVYTSCHGHIYNAIAFLELQRCQYTNFIKYKILGKFLENSEASIDNQLQDIILPVNS